MKKLIQLLLMKLRGEIPTERYIKTGMKVGTNFQRMQNCHMDYSHCWLIEIGNDVTFAPNVKLIAHDASTKAICGKVKVGRIRIGNNVFIGNSVIILPGITVGNNVVIGSGSVVTKDIPSNSVFGGNPCQFICSYDDYSEKISSQFLQNPNFDESYTIRGTISDKNKEEMKNRLLHSSGFVS